MLQDWRLVLSLAGVRGSWDVRYSHRRLPHPYNTMKPKILASALASNELVALLMVVRPVPSIVDDIVLVVCGVHEDFLQASADHGWM